MSSQHWILGFHLSPRHSTDISWTVTDMGEKTWLYLFLFKKKKKKKKTCPTSIWQGPVSLNNRAPMKSQKYFTHAGAFGAHPACITIIIFSFHFFQFHRRPQLTLHTATWMSSDDTWLSTCLMSLGSASQPYAVAKKKKKRVRLARGGRAL